MIFFYLISTGAPNEHGVKPGRQMKNNLLLDNFIFLVIKRREIIKKISNNPN